jgi:hypothetical protein
MQAGVPFGSDRRQSREEKVGTQEKSEGKKM